MQYYQISSIFFFILISYYCVQGQNSTDFNISSTSVTTDAQTKNSNVTSCPGGHIDFPNCTKCEVNYGDQAGKCLILNNDSKPTRNTGRRVTLILLACLLTVVLIVGFLAVYRRANQQRSNGPATNPNGPNRFNNILRSIGLNNLNQRGRFNFLSRSTNANNSAGQRQQTGALRTPLNDNPDEALLFDDPYADGGAANPYKSLTLAVS